MVDQEKKHSRGNVVPVNRLLIALLVGVCGLSGYLYSATLMSPLEAFAAITGALGIGLAVKESIWNWPISIVSSVAYWYVLEDAKLFADAQLQIVFVVFGFAGWYWWLKGDKGTAIQINRASKLELAVVFSCGVLVSYLIWHALISRPGTVPIWDATTTAFSLVALYFVIRKYIENWYVWIVVNIIYVPLYVYKHLPGTAALYFVLLVMAFAGLFEWRKLATT